MKIFAMCMQCQAELGHPSFEPFLADHFDDGIAYIECSNGHKSAFLLQSLKFELLLESGANALLHGFTLEACASFSVALERFYEFSLHVICIAQGMPEELFEKLFKEMARQSERQLGAFMMLYAKEFGEIYKLEPKFVKLRNNVIHNGEIPDLEETKTFCSWVYETIIGLFEKLSGRYNEHIQTIMRHKLRAKRKKLPANTSFSAHTGTMFFNISRTDNARSFTEALNSFATAQSVIAGAVPILQEFHETINAPKI